MADAERLVSLIEETVDALTRFDEESLLRLERESARLSFVERGVSSLDTRRIDAAMKVLRLTLEGAAANVRVIRRVRGNEEDRWAR